MKTYQPKKGDITRSWKLFDAKGKILGRLATEVAMCLMGKNKVNYSAHMESGDYAVVINAGDILVTGKKETQKVYRSHSGYPGGLKEVKYARLKKTAPEKIFEFAVKGMLPDNRLKAKRMARLKVFAGDNHPYKDKVKE